MRVITGRVSDGKRLPDFELAAGAAALQFSR
jgi:hypothetical protein